MDKKYDAIYVNFTNTQINYIYIYTCIYNLGIHAYIPCQK